MLSVGQYTDDATESRVRILFQSASCLEVGLDGDATTCHAYPGRITNACA